MPADFLRRSVDLDWVDLSARRRADPFGGAFEPDVYGANWRGVRVLRGKAGPGEIREGYLLGHLVKVHMELTLL